MENWNFLRKIGNNWKSLEIIGNNWNSQAKLKKTVGYKLFLRFFQFLSYEGRWGGEAWSFLELRKFLGPIPSGFLIQSLLKKRCKMLMELTGPIPLHFFIKSLLKVNGKCSWGFLCKLFNLDFEKLEHSNR